MRPSARGPPRRPSARVVVSAAIPGAAIEDRPPRPWRNCSFRYFPRRSCGGAPPGIRGRADLPARLQQAIGEVVVLRTRVPVACREAPSARRLPSEPPGCKTCKSDVRAMVRCRQRISAWIRRPGTLGIGDIVRAPGGPGLGWASRHETVFSIQSPAARSRNP